MTTRERWVVMGGVALVLLTWVGTRVLQPAMRAVLDTAREQLPGSTVKGVGHRVVHGGMGFAAPVEVTTDIIAELEKLSPLAPLHRFPGHVPLPCSSISQRQVRA